MNSKPESPRLRVTRDLSIFVPNEYNRSLRERPDLEASMTRYGFIPAEAIRVRKIDAGKDRGRLMVIKGHHRLATARKLGLPVWYIIDETDTPTNPGDVETQTDWSVHDYATAAANAGNLDVAAVLRFASIHKIKLSAAASLCGGESAGSHNKINSLKHGTFKLAADLRFANTVVAITDFLHDQGCPFARTTAFVNAISKVVLVPEFDPDIFKRRIRANGIGIIRRSATADQYVEQIEAAYNRSAHGKAIALAFLAKKIALERQAVARGRA
jgi:hypothetical protein